MDKFPGQTCNEESLLKSIGGPALRMKTFSECGIEEKVERLHSEIIDLRRSLQYANRMNNEMRTKLRQLENHQHSANGDCMIRVNDVRDNQGECGSSMKIDLLA